MAYTAKKLLASTALALTLSTSAAVADELRLDRIFVLGDSLSDAGTYSNSPRNGGLPANIRYRFTDNQLDGSSRTYAEVLGDNFGITVDPNVINKARDPATSPFDTVDEVGGTNFAQGGARVAEQPGIKNDANGDFANNTKTGISTIPVSQQVDRLLEQYGSFNDRDLVVLWGGNNDVLFQAGAVGAAARASDATAQSIGAAQQAAGGAIVQAGQAFVQEVQRVQDAGATRVVVVTVPDIGKNTPLGADGTPRDMNGDLVVGADGVPVGTAGITGLVNLFNATVAAGVEDKNVTFVTSDRLLNDVLNRPEAYGFSPNDAFGAGESQRTQRECLGESSLTCVDGVNSQNDGLERVFADDVHPTTRAHRVFGEAATGIFQNVTQVGAISVATLGGIRQGAIGLENRLNLGAIYVPDEATGESVPRAVGDFEVYGGAELGTYSADDQQILPGFDADVQVAKVAFDVPVAPKVVLGAGVSVDHAQTEFNDNRGSFDSRLFIGAVFGVAEIYRGVYVNGSLAYGHVDVYDQTRKINFTDGVTQTYEADTDGRYYSGKVSLGAMLPLGNGFLINPSVGFTHETVEIDGFDEEFRSDQPLAREFDDTDITANRVTLGLSGFYRPPAAQKWVFGLRGSYEYDLNDDELIVGSREAQSGQPFGTQSAPRPDRDFFFLSGNATYEVTEHGSLTLGASTVLGLDDVSGYTASLIYKHKF